MKNLFLAFTLVGLIGLTANAQNFMLSTSESSMKWTGEKVTGEHYGKINFKNGELKGTDGKVSSGAFTVDMKSISVTDIEDPEYNGKLVGHLKSDDFFGVESYPEANFAINSVAELKGKKETHLFTGVVTIKGKKKTVSIPAIVTMDGDKMMAKGTLVLDRSEFDIKYGSASFFDQLGDNLIYDEFTLDFNLVFKKA